MKKNIYGIVFFTSIILTACAQSNNIGGSYNDEPGNSISYQQFYDDLSPYGQWVDNPEYGYVWSPRETGFQPYYSNGHWAYTNYGWTWLSDYNWGWATFHYGRWFYDDFYGWMWVPGYDWAPAWVSWRGNSDYYGWAPLCPQRRDGSYYQVQNNQWAFVPHQYIYRNDLNNYYINKQNNSTYITNTTVINKVRIINNNTTYQEGPGVDEVEKASHTKIRTLAIQPSSIPGNTKLQNGVLQIYKPVIKQSAANESRPVPSSPGNRADESQNINGNGKTMIPSKNINAQPGSPALNNNPSLNLKDQSPVVKDNKAKIGQPGQDKLIIQPDKLSIIKALEPSDEQSKPVQRNQADPAMQNTGKAGLNVNPALRPNQNSNNNGNNNSVQPKTIPPAGNNSQPQGKINRGSSFPNNQQRTPVINQNSSGAPKSNFERVAPSFQNRTPQTMPVNVNRAISAPKK